MGLKLDGNVLLFPMALSIDQFVSAISSTLKAALGTNINFLSAPISNINSGCASRADIFSF